MALSLMVIVRSAVVSRNTRNPVFLARYYGGDCVRLAACGAFLLYRLPRERDFHSVTPMRAELSGSGRVGTNPHGVVARERGGLCV